MEFSFLNNFLVAESSAETQNACGEEVRPFDQVQMATSMKQELSIGFGQFIQNKLKCPTLSKSLRTVNNAVSVKVSSSTPPCLITIIVGRKDKIMPMNSEKDIANFCLVETM